MALSRTLELLKAGERINDLLYRSTLDGNRLALGRRWAHWGSGAPIASHRRRARPIATRRLATQSGTGR